MTFSLKANRFEHSHFYLYSNFLSSNFLFFLNFFFYFENSYEKNNYHAFKLLFRFEKTNFNLKHRNLLGMKNRTV